MSKQQTTGSTADNPAEQADHNELARLLVAAKEMLEQRLDGLSAELTEELPKNFSDQATQLENRDVELELRDEATAELAEIEAALNRINAGSYGICQSCGESIAVRRLEAYPAAALCIGCASCNDGHA